MTNNFKKLSLGILMFAIICAFTVLTAVADYSGTEANISWTLDTSKGVLTVSGSGTMPTYEKGEAPWYAHKTAVKSIVVNSGVTVSQGAFYGMESLTEITVPVIGDGGSNTFLGYIFGAVDYFQNVKYIPESLATVNVTAATEIPSYAFNNADHIKKVVLADTVTTVSSYAFKDCISLEYVVFGSGIKNIGANAFLRCDAVVHYFFKGTATGWNSVATNSNNISPIYLESGSLSVTPGAKTKFALGEKFDTTGIAVTFAGIDVTETAEIIVPDMFTIGTKAVTVVFGSKTASYNITVEAAGASGVSGVATWTVDTSAGTLTISGTGMMDNYTPETPAPWYGYRDFITSVTVGDGITTVGAYAFYNLNKVTSIVLPATIEAVEYGAFADCSKLATLTLGNMSATVDGTAFRNCFALITESNGAEYIKVSDNAYYALVSVDKSLTSFAIPETTVVIAESAFEGSALTSVIVPNSVITVGDNAFASSAALASVTLGTGVKYIGNYAFVDCGALSNIAINAVPDFVGAGAFSATAITGTTYKSAVYLGTADNEYAILWKAENEEITTVTIATGTQVIASAAFANCVDLASVQFASSLVHIGDSAFNNCTSLYTVRLPAALVTIGDNAFKGCTSLETVKLSSGLKVIGNAAFRSTAITEVVLNASIQHIGYNAYRDCTALTTVVYNAPTIGYKTFAGCTALTSVSLSDTVSDIGDYAFSGCTALTTVSIPDVADHIGFGAFYGCSAIKNLAIPFVGETSGVADGNFAYLFGADAPATYDILLVGTSIPANLLDGVSVNLLLIDKTVGSIAASAIDNAPATVYYLGSESDWAAVTKGSNSGLANINFANSTFNLTSAIDTYEVGDVFDKANFTANIGNIDVLSILRFVENPVTTDSTLQSAKIGSIEVFFKAKDVPDAEFTNYSLLLEGSIGVKFYVKLSELAMLNIDSVSASINYLDKDYDVDLIKADNTVDGSLYTVRFYVAPKEMQEPITLTINTLYSSESITKSVKDYVDYVNENSADYADSVKLINEMYNYGEYSRYYFDKATIDPNPDLSDVEIAIDSKYVPVKTGSLTGVTMLGSSLLLESNTTVRHYFSIEEGKSASDYTFTVNGTVVEPVEKAGSFYVEVKNIIAKDLGKLDKTVITNGEETLTIIYSPLSYVKIVLDGHTATKPKLANLSKALYNYYIAADEYFDSIIEDITPGEDESKPSIW